jgi:hypothetical protein
MMGSTPITTLYSVSAAVIEDDFHFETTRETQVTPHHTHPEIDRESLCVII